jgi:hypothetical protein
MPAGTGRLPFSGPGTLIAAGPVIGTARNVPASLDLDRNAVVERPTS